MCEILAITSSKPQPLNSTLKTFYKRSPEHPHGWGLGLFSDDDFVIEKEPVRAVDSERLKQILSEPLDYKTAIGHIRYATTGVKTLENTHPFTAQDLTGRNWVLAHNGTIKQAEELDKYRSIQKGDTDSERIFLYLLDNINRAIEEKNGDLSSEERFEVVEKTVSDIAGEDNKLNLMIYDGDQLYVQANGSSQMFYNKTDDTIYISTCPLITEEINADWHELPTMRVHAFKDGKLVRSGKEHGKKYIPNPEYEMYLYNKYAHL